MNTADLIFILNRLLYGIFKICDTHLIDLFFLYDIRKFFYNMKNIHSMEKGCRFPKRSLIGVFTLCLCYFRYCIYA